MYTFESSARACTSCPCMYEACSCLPPPTLLLRQNREEVLAQLNMRWSTPNEFFLIPMHAISPVGMPPLLPSRCQCNGRQSGVAYLCARMPCTALRSLFSCPYKMQVGLYPDLKSSVLGPLPIPLGIFRSSIIAGLGFTGCCASRSTALSGASGSSSMSAHFGLGGAVAG